MRVELSFVKPRSFGSIVSADPRDPSLPVNEERWIAVWESEAATRGLDRHAANQARRAATFRRLVDEHRLGEVDAEYFLKR